ncbi:MAG: pyridoxal phosphate-dependent aminotransferase [Clostridia bacterium]|nr:pyridoxal phosphate-dependent aminotransferase [Clostridia bacterium]
MISETMYELGSRRSSIRELFEYGKKAAAEVGAENVYDFSLGNPSTPPPAALTETLETILREEEPCAVHGYTSAQGALETRQAVADDLNARFGAGLTADRLYMTCGAAASLCITLRALTVKNNSRFVVQAPYFPEYKVFVSSMGGELAVAEADTATFDLNLTAIEALITPDTQGIIVNSPNNPSGVIYSEAKLTELAALLTRKSQEYGHSIYLISDEPYREITYGKKVPYLPHIYPDTVICYSYSKSLSLPGERIGYIAVPEGVTDGKKLYAAVCGAGRALGYVCAPALMQKAVARCGGLTSDIESYRKNRDLLYAALTAMGYECVVPDGAFYLFVKAPNGDAKAFSEAAKKVNILLVAGDDFGCPGYARIAYCVDHDRIKRSLPAFGKLIDSLS